MTAVSAPGAEPSSVTAVEQESTVSAASAAFVPSNAELNIQQVPNSTDRHVEVRFSWNSLGDLSGFSDTRSALEIQVLFYNQADDAARNNVSYVGGDDRKAFGANFGSSYFDTPALNNNGIAGSPYEHEVTVGSYSAHSEFQAGRPYMSWAIMEKGELDANFAKLSFQRGIYRPTIRENRRVYLYCLAHGGSDPASCFAGVETIKVTPVNYTEPTSQSWHRRYLPSYIQRQRVRYPEGINFNTLTEQMPRNLVAQILPFQNAFTRNGSKPDIGCPTNFVHKDTA